MDTRNNVIPTQQGTSYLYTRESISSVLSFAGHSNNDIHHNSRIYVLYKETDFTYKLISFTFLLENSVNLLSNSWKVLDCPSGITLLHGLAVFIKPKSYKGGQVIS